MHGHRYGGFDEFDMAAVTSRIASRLDLTESQKADLEQIAGEIAEKAKDMHVDRASRRQEIGDLIRQDTVGKDRLPGVEPGPLVDIPVNADPEKMRVVLRNLLDNALKHTPEDGPAVLISTAFRPDRLEIVVEDRGEGIPTEALPHLFEPFYRPDVSRSRKTGGYGLGLSLCKAIVDAHGGTIDLISAPGEGTRVTVMINRHGTEWSADP
jgi:signal transduction histidine kinase